MLVNVVNAAALWCLWNLRNRICFQGEVWLGMKKVLTEIAKNLKKMETDVQGGDGGGADGGSSKDRAGSKKTTWNRLESITFSSIGVAALGGGLYRCGSAEF